MVAASDLPPNCSGLRVRIVGADSLGVRSMATFIEAGGVKIAVDPGVSYAPRRYGLPPHPVELKRVEEVRDEILRELEDTDVIVVTHYHYDHYLYRSEWYHAYKGKTLIVKHPEQNINASQKVRAYRLLKKGGVASLVSRLEYGDGRRFELPGGVVVEVSPPVPHGVEGTRLGYVVMVMVEYDGCRFVHASDVQGPASETALRQLLGWRPDVVFLSGPPLYRESVDDDGAALRGLEGLRTLAREVPLVVVDHHMARSLDYPERLREVNREAGVEALTSAARFMGRECELLEARRKELWSKEQG